MHYIQILRSPVDSCNRSNTVGVQHEKHAASDAELEMIEMMKAGYKNNSIRATHINCCQKPLTPATA
jgi:hypothetical protein